MDLILSLVVTRLAADDQRVFTAELRAHFLDGGAHGLHVFRLAEIGEGLVAERPNGDCYGRMNGSHKYNLLVGPHRKQGPNPKLNILSATTGEHCEFRIGGK